MKKILLSTALLISSFVLSQAVAAYQSRVNLVSQTNLQTYDTDLVNIGVRKTGSANAGTAVTYLQNKFLSFGYTASDITFDTWTYSTANDSKNIIVTKTGTLYPTQYVIMCAHYDSFSGSTAATQSVGANDNGTGSAIVLETARILKNVQTDYSIKFIIFTGEEQGLLGSKNYVNKVVNATTPKMAIRLVFNLDQVGGRSDRFNNTINCEADRYVDELGTVHTSGTKTTNDAASLTFTTSLAQYVGYYSSLTAAMNYAYGSDYMPFENNGEIVCGFYERPTSTATINTNYNSNNVVTNPYYHNNTDTIPNLSYTYVFEVAKAAVGAMQHFAVASTSTLGTCTPQKMVSTLEISPNPAKDFIKIKFLNSNTNDFKFTVTDFLGKVILETKNQTMIDTSELPKGVYLGTLTIGDQSNSKKIIIK